MLKVGLTGGIACGKSVVRRRLAELGAYTLDADAIVHELMAPGTELTLEIESSFGARDADGGWGRRSSAPWSAGLREF